MLWNGLITEVPITPSDSDEARKESGGEKEEGEKPTVRPTLEALKRTPACLGFGRRAVGIDVVAHD